MIWILFNLSPVLDSLVVNRLLEKQLDEENVEAAVEDRGQGMEHVEMGKTEMERWKNWDGGRECSKNKVKEKAKAKQTDVKGVAVRVLVPRELPYFEESKADGDHSSKV